MTNNYDIKLAVEIDENVSKTFKQNHQNTFVLNKDITEIKEEDIFKIVDKVDIVIESTLPRFQFSRKKRLKTQEIVCLKSLLG